MKNPSHGFSGKGKYGKSSLSRMEVGDYNLRLALELACCYFYLGYGNQKRLSFFGKAFYW
jgi:hypothetical protein